MVTLPLDLLNLLLAAVLPMLTALITARFANSAVKAVVLLLLNIIATALQAVFDKGGIVDGRDFLLTTGLQFVMAVAFHFGLLKPVNVTGAHGAIQTAVPAGVGGPAQVNGPVDD